MPVIVEWAYRDHGLDERIHGQVPRKAWQIGSRARRIRLGLSCDIAPIRARQPDGPVAWLWARGHGRTAMVFARGDRPFSNDTKTRIRSGCFLTLRGHVFLYHGHR